jgi:hypothetical protein
LAFSGAVDLPEKACRRLCPTKGVLLFLFMSAAANGLGEGFSFDSAGTRFGMGSNRSSRNFYEAEAFTDVNLPGGWDLGQDMRLDTRLDLGVGWLAERSSHTAVGEVGPLLVLRHKQFPLSVALGSNATGLGRSDFETKNLGISFQFTTYIGLNWDITRFFRMGYRYQHMSNAGLDGSNPGLNMHMVSFGYLF